MLGFFDLEKHPFPADVPTAEFVMHQLTYDEDRHHEKRIMADNYRQDFINRYGFSLITEEEIKILVDFIGDRKVVDVGCGTGYLTRVLRVAGIDIDGMDYNEGSYNDWTYQIDDVIKADYSKADLSQWDIVLCSWPCLGDPSAAKMLVNLKPGTVVFYLGEGCGGCCATDEFFHLIMECCEEEIQQQLNNHHWVFDGSHDYWKAFTIPVNKKLQYPINNTDEVED